MRPARSAKLSAALERAFALVHSRFMPSEGRIAETLKRSKGACIVFGAPSFFIGEEMWFGKDKLRGVEEALVA